MKIIKGHRPTRRLMRLVLLFPLVIATSLFLPRPVLAAPAAWDIGANVTYWLKETILGAAGVCFNLYFGIVGDITKSSYVTGSFSKLFGTEEVYSLVSSIHQTTVIPVAQAILGLFMLVQLIKISQRIDATSTLPAVKEIVFLVVTFSLMSWFIDNSLGIVTSLYNIFNQFAGAIVQDGTAPNGLASALTFSDSDIDAAQVGNCILLVFIALLSVLVGFVAYIVSLTVALARGIQLYVMAAFSPVPISLMGFEETKQMGIGFLKNFASAALAGAIMIFTLVAYPHIVASTVATIQPSELVSLLSGEIAAHTIEAFLNWLAISFMLILALVKSGAWAKEILGS